LDERVYTKLCEAVIDEPEKLAQNLAVWAALRDFNKELRAPMLNPKDLAERTVKSLVVEDLAVAYVDGYTRAGFGDMCTLYMHHSMRHIPRMILRLPLDISVVSQQGLEHLLKAGKTDALVFSNKRLRGDGQDMGRNKQVLGKERERKRMRVEVPMQKSRTERRMESDQEKVAGETVDRAEARGLLRSRTDHMIAQRVAKRDASLQLFMEAHQATRGASQQGADSQNDEGPTAQRASLLLPSAVATTAASGSLTPTAGLDLSARNALNVSGTAGEVPSAAVPAAAVAAGAGGPEFAAEVARGGNSSARGGRGRGSRGRGAGSAGSGSARSTVGGRRIPASARMQR
jgi:hypothetical protein